MFLMCEDFIDAGLHAADECCEKCHHDAEYKPRSFRPKLPFGSRFSDIKYYCCCSFASKEFTAEQLDTLIQKHYKRIDTCR